MTYFNSSVAINRRLNKTVFTTFSKNSFKAIKERNQRPPQISKNAKKKFYSSQVPPLPEPIFSVKSPKTAKPISGKGKNLRLRPTPSSLQDWTGPVFSVSSARATCQTWARRPSSSSCGGSAGSLISGPGSPVVGPIQKTKLD